MANNNYNNGRKTENELLDHFRNEGHAAYRVAGSGGNTDVHADVIVLTPGGDYIFECKKWSDGTGYIDREQIDGLVEDAERARGRPLLAIRRDGNSFDQMWAIYRVEDLGETEQNYKVDDDMAESASGLEVF